MPDEVFDFDLLLAHSAGSIGRGEPRLYARLRAVFVRGHRLSGALLSVLAHERDTGAWREWSACPTERDVRALLAALTDAGCPSRTARAEGIVDTSMAYESVLCRIKTADHRWEVELTMQSSGFDGPDAPALKSAFRSLFALAGCGAFDPAVFGATGEQDGPRSA